MAFAFAGQWGPEPAIDRFGNAVYSATFRVLTTAGVEATVYTDRTKTTTASQPLDVDGEGNATFYAAPGRYTIELTAGGSVTSFPVGVTPDAEDVAPRDPAEWTEGNATYATLTPRPVNPLNRADAALNALGDNSGAALSSRFGSLTEAQAKFPHVTALTQTIDWAALKSVLDVGSRVADLPPATFAMGADGLVVTKNVSIEAADPRHTKIVAGAGMGATTDVITVAITDNSGNTDVRNWRIKNVTVQAASGGRHALYFDDDTASYPIYSSLIANNNLLGNAANGGYSIYADNNLAHCEIVRNTIQSSIYMKCNDANVIRKNMFFGTRIAVVFDLAFGVKNNTVADNTIVNRDGAVHIIDGDDVRIINNQVELALGHTPQENQSPTSSMVWIQGATRKAYNTVIENNNLGGGTNLNHLIYVDNAEKTVIDKNDLVAVNVAEVYFTANATYNILGRRNFVRHQTSNPRTRTRFKAEVVDLGVGNMGVLHPGSELAHQNGWLGGDFFKDEYGVVHFQSQLTSGTTADGTVIGTLPVGFRPAANTRIVCPTSTGVGRLFITSTGQISAEGLPSNVTYPQSFTTGQTDS